MRILIAGDSRSVIPMPNDLVVRFNQIQEGHEVKTIRAFYDHWLFSLHVLAEYLESQEKFDLTIIQAGWHEGVCHWTVDILQYITGHRFNPQALCEPKPTVEFARPPASYKGWGVPQQKTPESFLYIDREYEQEIINIVKSKSEHCIFIGMHSLKHDNGLNQLHQLGIKHHKDVLRMINAISGLDIDFLHMPMDFNWVQENTTEDNIHYSEAGLGHIVGFLSRYVDRIGLTINQVIEKSNPVFYEKAQLFGSAIAKYTEEGDVVLLSKKTGDELFLLFIGCVLYKRIPLVIQRPSFKVHKKDFEIRMQNVLEVGPAICFCEEENQDEYGQFFKCVSQVELGEKIPEPTIDSDDVAFLQMSSGTTGTSKIVRITHKQIISHCDEYARSIDFDSDSVTVSWLPLYHDMGLVSSFLLPLLKGAQFHIIDPFDWLSSPGEILNMVYRHRATHMWMPSFAFNYISKHAETNDADLSSITHIISCSEPTFYHDIIQFQDKFQRNNLKNCLSVCYALAENVFAVSQSDSIKSSDCGGVSYVSCGRILPGVSIIIEKEGEDVTNDSEGRVMMRSSYEPKNNDRSEFYGYYDTGDIGFMKDQELYIIGRAKDSFVSYGVNVYPEVIEHEVSKMKGVLDGRVACFGIFSEQSGTCECNICAETNCLEGLEESIHLRVREVFGLHAFIRFVPPGFLSKTSSGKISRSKTKELICNKKY